MPLRAAVARMPGTAGAETIAVDFGQAAPQSSGTMLSKLFIGIAGLSGPACCAPKPPTPAATPASSQGVQITQLADRLRVEINGQLFTEYYLPGCSATLLLPAHWAGRAAMTRNWPMKTTPDEEQDHPHHRSFWFAHGAVNGHDFWSEEKAFGKTVHDGFVQVKSGLESASSSSRTTGWPPTELWSARMNAPCASTTPGAANGFSISRSRSSPRTGL